MLGQVEVVHSMETDLLNGSRYINLVSECLKDKLPHTVTKEELMNHYLHEMKAKGLIDFNVTVVNLVQAANLANIKVKGQSKLEVNVAIADQWKYISNNVKTTQGKLSRKAVKERLYNNKDDIVAAYERGATIKELASAWNVSTTPMHKYLIEFGATIRKAGKKKIYGGSEMIVKDGLYSYGKKKRRKQHAK